MQRIKFMWRQFLKQPGWFKLVIIITFLVSIIFSSTYFSGNDNYEGISKLAGAIFFWLWGYNTRRNRQTSNVLFILAAICTLLAIWAFL
ncbi:hypothetical protein [Psychrobacillus antarcticus]|uniref:hypothetical protein n=1 Tax=Psychrobacillus antarcticus TaxID=2879115 RepID=UPI0024085E38|nr:hypothetical protein [Psychrobacillus antarcticus]